MILKKATGLLFLLTLLAVTTSVILSFKHLQSKELEIKTSLEESFRLANPGLEITDLILVRDGSMYKVFVKMGNDLVEYYTDSDGKYLFTVATDVKGALQDFKSQKSFYDCLRNKQVVLFGVSTVNATISQIKILGNSPYLGSIYFDCSGENLEFCLNNNITAVPAWLIDELIYETTLSIPAIEAVTNCTYGQ